MARSKKQRRKRKQPKENKVTFRSGTRIGFADAEDDLEFLHTCYVETGHFRQALDTDDPGSILLGRTGSGKTAALAHIENVEENVIRLNPEDLALDYISNSTILRFLESLDVDLDVFFQLLWRHVICIELLRYILDKQKMTDLQSILATIVTPRSTRRAMNRAQTYLKKWESHFWEESQKKMEEIVTNFENDLKTGVDFNGLGLPINAETALHMDSGKRIEIEQQARHVVSKVQIRDLAHVMDVLEEDILTNKQLRYYILIDKLDENWVDDNLRYRLIRALIETIKSFRKMSNVKLVIAIRADLLERVYKYNKGSGFQDEKYEDFNIRISWRKDQLFDLVNRRIGEMFRRQYTKDSVEFYDVFLQTYRQRSNMFEYLVSRTQYRPRDIIAFINQIFITAAGSSQISAKNIDEAESEYSRLRLRALCTEWSDEHPNLEKMVNFLRRLPGPQKVTDLNSERLENFVLELAAEDESPDGMPQMALRVYEGLEQDVIFRRNLLAILYKVGAIGVKNSRSEIASYCFAGTLILGPENVNDDMYFEVAPMLWATLGIVGTKGRSTV